jgi:hypothetical protein
VTVEQLGAEMGFEMIDPSADGRLRNAHRLARLIEALGARRAEEIADVLPIAESISIYAFVHNKNQNIRNDPDIVSPLG